MGDTITPVHWLRKSSLDSTIGVDTIDTHSIEEETTLIPE